MSILHLIIFSIFQIVFVTGKDYTKFVSFIQKYLKNICNLLYFYSYKVYDVTPNQQQIADLVKWEFQAGVEFLLTSRAGRASKILVAPETEDSFLDFLKTSDIPHVLTVNDVEPVLQKNRDAANKLRAKRNALFDNFNPNFEHYWTFEEIEAYSVLIAQQYPSLVKRDVIGKSVEGRDIFGLRISSASDMEFGKKPIIFIDTGTHAREWVGPHTVLYFLDQLVTNSSVTNSLLEKVDYVIIPNVNPDGYVYTHTEDRFWRKNRRQVNYTCSGIDLNRNYGYVWEYVPNSVSSINHKFSKFICEFFSSVLRQIILAHLLFRNPNH